MAVSTAKCILTIVNICFGLISQDYVKSVYSLKLFGIFFHGFSENRFLRIHYLMDNDPTTTHAIN